VQHVALLWENIRHGQPFHWRTVPYRLLSSFSRYLWYPHGALPRYAQNTQQRSVRAVHLLQLIAGPQMRAFYMHKRRPDRFVPMKEGKIENESWFRRLEKIKISLCSPQRNTKFPPPPALPHNGHDPHCPYTYLVSLAVGRPVGQADTHNSLWPTVNIALLRNAHFCFPFP
jgi:hypothetical protein